MEEIIEDASKANGAKKVELMQMAENGLKDAKNICDIFKATENYEKVKEVFDELAIVIPELEQKIKRRHF